MNNVILQTRVFSNNISVTCRCFIIKVWFRPSDIRQISDPSHVSAMLSKPHITLKTTDYILYKLFEYVWIKHKIWNFSSLFYHWKHPCNHVHLSLSRPKHCTISVKWTFIQTKQLFCKLISCSFFSHNNFNTWIVQLLFLIIIKELNYYQHNPLSHKYL